ncbi:hypothetical protein Dvina_16155 [Dactylosporangium vinaceum]|uniref:Uncharacterized protein n=1 Tax=Dactylosporangium vinaceum TaxID=53362 RepID=A0ABV5M907_9ACTN|nr:hypothetical protein [Dactylosporangium vinaceum]UAB99468.1 hypothetical protein Dvina_16155 [Dactylosporangium vinaceum]
MTSPSGRIDQIVFRWRTRASAGGGQDGVGPDATSLTESAVAWWDERLALRITRAPGRNERPSLAYLRVDAYGVVLHKVPARDDHGRPGAAVAHALIGPAELINVQLALGLEHWPHWAGRNDPGAYPPGRVGTVPFAVLREHADAALAQPVNDPGGAFDELLDRVLANPAAPLTVVMPDAPATALVRGLVDVLGDVRDLTFAANEDDDTDPDLPRLVFLDAVTGGSGYAATRERLYPGQPGARVDGFTQQLADMWRRGGAAELAPLRGGRSLSRAADVQQWEREVVVGGRILQTTLLEAVTTGQAAPEHLELLHTEAGQRQIEAEAAKLNDGDLATAYQTWQPGGQVATRYPGASQVITRLVVQRAMRSGASKTLREALKRSAFDPELVDAHLRAWAAHGRNANAGPAAIVELAQLAASFGVPPALQAPGMRALMDRISLADLIELANRYTGSNVHTAELLLSAAEGRGFDPGALDAAQMALERTDYLIYCIPFLPGDARIAQDRWQRLLRAVFGAQLGDEHGRVHHDVLKFLGRKDAPEVPPALAFALRTFPGTLTGKARVDQLAARDFYLAAGLEDIWPERDELLRAERTTKVMRQRSSHGDSAGTVTRSAVAAAPARVRRSVEPRLLMIIGGAALVVVALVAVVIFAMSGGSQ